MYNFTKILVALLLVNTLSGCGSSNDTPIGDTYVFPMGKAVITFSAISTARLTVPVSALDISFSLPPGMSVSTIGGGTGQIASASVTAGSALAGTNLAFGSYSASTRKVRLSMAVTSSNYRSGEFLRLLCDVASDTAISMGDVRALNAPVTVLKAVGYDPATTSTVVLTNNVKVVIGVSH